MTGQDDKKKEAKGFAGLSDLVPDIDAAPPPVEADSPKDARPSPAPASKAAPAQSKPPTPPPRPKPTPPKSSDSSSGGKWVIGIVVVLGVFWLIGQADKRPTNAPSGRTSGSQVAPGSSYQAPSRPEEVKPPVGQDLVLSTAQIRYCLAEDIRMDGAKSSLNNYSDADVDRFNAMVSDYNSRCGSFRYRRGALESARREIEAYRSELHSDGRTRFARNPSAAVVPSSPPSRPIRDPTVEAIQKRLNELGYNAGSVDGLMGRGTRAAILAFQARNGIAQDGRASAELLSALNSERSALSSNPPSLGGQDRTRERSVHVPPPALQERPSTGQVRATTPSKDPENFQVCISGQYPSLCKHSLLTAEEAAQVAEAERRANFQTCVSGSYASLCNRSLLTPEQVLQVDAAERRENFQTCISGNYPSLCKRHLLTADEVARVNASERRANFQTCISGNYPSLCKHSMLTADEAEQVAAAERRANFRTCISGNYPSLCKHSLLSPEEAAQVAAAERRQGNR